MANSKELGRAGTSTFALKNRPRATRAMVAKVRTGCITCKRRHVKCDENKPACHRCIKWRGTCEGYEERLSGQSRTKQEPGTSRSQSQETDVSNLPTAGPSEQIPQWYPHLANEAMKLLSRPSDLINAASPMSPNPSPLSLELPSTAVPQHSGLEGSFWMQTVPGLLRANSSVKYANLAIHALIDSKRPQWVEEGPKLPGRDSYSRALRYHGQAIGAVREKTAGRESLQSATLCSLFFIIFEMMNGDVNAAQAHMYNGCRMMAELRTLITGRPVTGIENMLFRELQKALRFVAMQVQGAVSNYEESKPVKTEGEVKAEPKTEVEADVDVCKKEEKEEEEEAKPSIGLDAIEIKQEPHTPLPTD